MAEMMKAAVVEQDGSLLVRDVPVPRYGEYEALVRLTYGATCAGTDQSIMEGKHPRPIRFPAILGHESVGRVVAAGNRVTSFREGDVISRVGAPPCPELGIGTCWGGFAQYGIATDWQAMKRDGVPGERWDRFRVQQVIPPDIRETDGPMFITLRETLSYATRLGVQRGDKVLLTGSGANALAFLFHCVYAGAEVAVVGNAGRLPRALAAGAAAAIDYKAADLALQLERAFPRGIDHIIDAVGIDKNINLALPLLKENGQVGVYGWHGRYAYGIQPFAAGRSFRVYCGSYDEAETHDLVIERIREGALRAEDWYDRAHPVPLADIARAYRDLQARKALKYLIDLA